MVSLFSALTQHEFGHTTEASFPDCRKRDREYLLCLVPGTHETSRVKML